MLSYKMKWSPVVMTAVVLLLAASISADNKRVGGRPFIPSPIEFKRVSRQSAARLSRTAVDSASFIPLGEEIPLQPNEVDEAAHPETSWSSEHEAAPVPVPELPELSPVTHWPPPFYNQATTTLFPVVEEAPLEHAVAEHAVVEHAVLEHAAEEHAAVEHAAVEHAPVEHTPEEHAAVEHVEHVAEEHAPVEHAPVEHAPVEHAPVEHVAEEHASVEHAAEEHAHGVIAIAVVQEHAAEEEHAPAVHSAIPSEHEIPIPEVVQHILEHAPLEIPGPVPVPVDPITTPHAPVPHSVEAVTPPATGQLYSLLPPLYGAVLYPLKGHPAPPKKQYGPPPASSYAAPAPVTTYGVAPPAPTVAYPSSKRPVAPTARTLGFPPIDNTGDNLRYDVDWKRLSSKRPQY